jgi:chloramphenicol 3-O-phosphotransferase
MDTTIRDDRAVAAPTTRGTVFVVTGPSGAGKTTVGRLLARSFERGVHLEGDVFRRSIVSGRQEMTPDPSREALTQLELRYRVAAAAVDQYAGAGFAAVLEDVIAGPMLGEIATLVRARPLHVVVLLPRPEVVAARDAARASSGYARWSVDVLHELFAARTPRIGLWLDTSEQTPEQTVAVILAGAAYAPF